MKRIVLPPMAANPDNAAEFGLYIGDDTTPERRPVPFYQHVDAGSDLPFEYPDEAVIRLSRVHPCDNHIVWLERHNRLTQFFIGLGSSPFFIVLGLADKAEDINPARLKCLVFAPGTGILLNRSVWHEFPMALDRPVTCMAGNSLETVQALTAVTSPREMNEGDVEKIHVAERFQTEVYVSFQ